MPSRKQTPDILSQILDEGARPEPAAEAPIRRTRRQPTSKATPQLEQPEAEQREPSHLPTRWEHRIVSFQANRGWRPRFVDGQPVADWASAPPLAAYIAQMGEEGWEVAAASSGQHLYGAADMYQVFFKRPKV